jgi:type III secretory pathway component EscS
MNIIKERTLLALKIIADMIWISVILALGAVLLGGIAGVLVRFFQLTYNMAQL